MSMGAKQNVETVGDILDSLPPVQRAVAIPRREAETSLDVVAANPMSLIAQAVANGAPVETMEKLLALQERWEANEARKAFVVAMAAFKAEPPEIVKNKHVGFGSKRGGTDTSYYHATLDNVCAVVNPALAKQGLSYRWETQQLDGGVIRVSCIVTHVLGHTERTFLQGSGDTSGNKNIIQAIGSTVTYLERYTLLSALGLATVEMDDDAGSLDSPIGADQVAQVQAALDSASGEIVAFCKWMGVDSLAAIPTARFKIALDAIEAKKRKKRKGGGK